jgi:hypothetical protein
MYFHNHGVNFLVAKTLTSFYLIWSLINTQTIRELSLSIVAADTLTTFLLTALMSVNIAIVSLVLVNMLVNPFITIWILSGYFNRPEQITGLQPFRIP